MNEPRSDREWADFFSEQQGLYEAFADNLERLLETLLYENSIDYSWALAFLRGPDVEDIKQARRPGLAFDNPLETLRLAGVTIFVETSAVVPEIVDLVNREFSVDLAGSLTVDEAAARNARLSDLSELAYESPYYLVSLDERRSGLAEWAPFAGLQVRIEVKTELQNAWERIDRDLPFFAATSYPREVRDLLARSALRLSTIDADLAEARHAVFRLLAEYEEAIAAGELELPVNGISLLAYMTTSDLVGSLTELGQNVGLETMPDYAPGWQEIEHGILGLLRRADVHTIGELEDFLKQATPRARETLTELVRVATDQGFTPLAQPESIVEWLWLVLHRADGETISALSYVDEVEYALNTLIGNPTTRASAP